MKSTDRTLLMIVPAVVILIGFYMMVISPKRSEIADLDGQLVETEAALASAEDQIAVGEAARDGFSDNYAQIVRLGKATPEDGGQSDLILAFAELGKKNDVKFNSFAIGGSGGANTPEDAVNGPAEEPADGVAPPPAAAEAQPVAVTPTTPALATEASAASLPLGATVGAAGLPLVPYTFTFNGDFFDLADFFADIDDLVSTSRDGEPVVDGRLVTIDSFELQADAEKDFPALQADFDVTTYIVPPEQGLAAGVSPAGPSPSGLASVPTTSEASP